MHPKKIHVPSDGIAMHLNFDPAATGALFVFIPVGGSVLSGGARRLTQSHYLRRDHL